MIAIRTYMHIQTHPDDDIRLFSTHKKGISSTHSMRQHVEPFIFATYFLYTVIVGVRCKKHFEVIGAEGRRVMLF